MAKVSFASKDAYESKFGFREGWFEVVDSKIAVYQYNPNKTTGEQAAPILALVMSFQKTDEAGKHVEEDPQEVVLSISNDLERMRPGHVDSPDDDDPSDLGSELGTEGNCVYSDGENKINSNTKFMVWIKGLEQHGFKPTITQRGFAPDYIGLKGKAHYESRQVGSNKADFLVIDTLKPPFPYETTTTTKAAAKQATPKAQAATAGNGGGKTNATTGTTSPTNAAAEELATDTIIALAGELSGQTRKVAALRSLAYARFIKVKPRDQKVEKPAQDLLKNIEWLTALGETLGFTIEGDDVKFS